MEVIIISLQKYPTNTQRNVQELLGLQYCSSVRHVHPTSHDLRFLLELSPWLI